jgi:hypothetical protein
MLKSCRPSQDAIIDFCNKHLRWPGPFERGCARLARRRRASVSHRQALGAHSPPRAKHDDNEDAGACNENDMDAAAGNARMDVPQGGTILALALFLYQRRSDARVERPLRMLRRWLHGVRTLVTPPAHVRESMSTLVRIRATV